MDDLGDYPQSIPIEAEEKIIEVKDPLALEIDDTELLKITKDYETKSKGYFAKIRLKDRQNRNFSYLFARENNSIDNLLNKKRQYSDNLLYEIESTLKPLATSKDPDILVYPAQEQEQSIQSAKDLTLALQHSLNVRELKEVKALAFKHLPVYFIACVKYRWNPAKGKNGDYEFITINPQNLILDNNAKGRDTNKMSFIGEYQDVSVNDLIMRFPDKEEEIWQELINEGKVNSKEDPGATATKVKITEWWFRYPVKKGDKWTTMNGVLWRYKNILFKKMKNPNWDWQGQKIGRAHV